MKKMSNKLTLKNLCFRGNDNEEEMLHQLTPSSGRGDPDIAARGGCQVVTLR